VRTISAASALIFVLASVVHLAVGNVEAGAGFACAATWAFIAFGREVAA